MPPISLCSLSIIFILSTLSASLPAADTQPEALPTVDLGYIHQRATSYNSTSGLYTFKNIRYARPPIGDLRFRKPLPPVGMNTTTVSDGTEYNTTICSQPNVLYGVPNPITPSEKGFTEDCLFLDVYVPQNIMTNNLNSNSSVPVLVWIYGGGYTTGSKDDLYVLPNGLFGAAKEGIIFVAINYRLGYFGWSSPPSESSITPNLGFHDATAALNWVKNYIHLFGGNGSDITVFGESAGGGIIMHLITAYGGREGGPVFNKAIIQSPGFIPIRHNLQRRENKFKSFLTASNCTDLGVACLRQAPTDVLQAANANATADEGSEPVVDGDFTPDLPSKLLFEGKFHKDVRVVVGNNEFEGRFFVRSPENTTQETFDGFLTSLLPNISSSDKTRIGDLYLNGSIYDRTVELYGDISFNCHAQALGETFGALNKNKGFRYVFSVPPAQHGDDIVYTFYPAGDQLPDVQGIPVMANTTVALTLQTIIASLALGDVPPRWSFSDTMEGYGSGSGNRGKVLLVSNTTIETADDEWKNERCQILGRGMYTQG